MNAQSKALTIYSNKEKDGLSSSFFYFKKRIDIGGKLMIEIIKTTISNQSAKVELLDTIYSNNKEQYRVHFIFDTDDWDNYKKMVVFDRVKNYDTPIGINITEENSELVEIINEKEFYCVLPWEVITQPGYFNISIYGTYTNEKGELLTKNFILPDKFTIQNGGDKTVYPRIPTPNMYEQLVSASESSRSDAAEAKQMAAAASKQAEVALNSTLTLQKEIKTKVSQQQVEEMIGATPTTYVFDDLEELNIYLNSEEFKNKLNTGDSFYIKDREVADYWWDGNNIQPIETLPSDIGVSLVGQKTSHDGEIFNDYENNKANTLYTHAEGSDTTAGAMGFNIVEQPSIKGNEVSVKIHLSYNPDNKEEYNDWRQCYAQLDLADHFYNIFKIIKIQDYGFVTLVLQKENGSTITEDFSLDESGDNYLWITTDPVKTDSTGKETKTRYESKILGGNTPVNHHEGAHSEGINTRAWGYGAHSEGRETRVMGDMGHAEGNRTVASYSAHAEGNLTEALGYQSHAEGYQAKALGGSSHAEGLMTTASGSNSHVEGENSIASGRNSHAEGVSTQAIGKASHAEGDLSIANGSKSHAEGNKTTANGEASHAEGVGTFAEGYSAHAEGIGNNALKEGSHAEGAYTNASGNYAHAEGAYTNASGIEAHTEGLYTNASGNQSHAEGAYTNASGAEAHAEGYKSIASGQRAHAQGSETQALGFASHAEGHKAVAKKGFSHASGIGTSANAEAQMVIGKYNKEDESALFIVGKGSSDAERSNAFVVKDDGTAEVQVTGINDNNVVNYKQLKDYVAKNSISPWDEQSKLLFSTGDVRIENADYEKLGYNNANGRIEIGYERANSRENVDDRVFTTITRNGIRTNDIAENCYTNLNRYQFEIGERGAVRLISPKALFNLSFAASTSLRAS